MAISLYDNNGQSVCKAINGGTESSKVNQCACNAQLKPAVGSLLFVFP